MKRFFYCLSGVLIISALAFFCSCGSTWEISGNSVNVEVMQRDSLVTVPAGTSVFCVDTPDGSLKCYAVPQK